ncbi:NAD(P)-dependent iron-only hydrogenase catalytic subunit [Carboxydocella sporoproducens DSM 16521]|uniref:NAD(P)-dependent iron-only hydrogenase catalytic subunit n=3 Tax=Clostridiales Family XVI. Incertae Sedis TaxID=543347 RepID=A0A1T4S3Q8_9FIRM|nr:[FeFe]-hydrogenase catalytic subunit [Carboxydocella thermautotrophica]AVX31640.1 [FeFe]-hydrogenase catalytic subunit [Carboxydocella thermautotrophica]SKA22929.1 NAD(P)-dependent iron-only hydrogenase catalytic subunit [Carboxydocella sporoproducens DSM 16521]
MTEMVQLTIDGQTVEVPAGTTVLEAARQLGIKIPTLCYMKELNEIGACRVCLVEVQGARTLQAACVLPVSPGMVVNTKSPAVREARRTAVELIISDHPQECLTCARNRTCELRVLAEEVGVRQIPYTGATTQLPVDASSPSIVRDPRKCVLCRRCVAVCQQVQQVGCLQAAERGFDTNITPAFGDNLNEAVCTFCGQCVLVCPTGALTEKNETARVWSVLANPEKHVVVQVAPAVRVSIGEELGYEPGTVLTGKLVAALRRLGFDRVFDTNFAADLTIMEEGHELLERLEEGGSLPLITSCCPGWVKYIEHFFPDLLKHLSSCKSPHQMFGAVAKTYYASKHGIDPASIVVVSIMPCTAKKFEIQRPEMQASSYQDVDIVLTTRELGAMLREAGLDLRNLPDEDFDQPLGQSTGAGVIFGTTGGVMEAALRTVAEVTSGQPLAEIEFQQVRGFNGIKEAEVELKGRRLKLAVAHGLANAKQLLTALQKGEAEYHFIEIMACHGGCIGGGGQPIPTTWEVRQKRAQGIYQCDSQARFRKSHENPAIKELYAEFLGHPLSHKSHQLLHTRYQPRR